MRRTQSCVLDQQGKRRMMQILRHLSCKEKLCQECRLLNVTIRFPDVHRRFLSHGYKICALIRNAWSETVMKWLNQMSDWGSKSHNWAYAEKKRTLCIILNLRRVRMTLEKRMSCLFLRVATQEMGGGCWVIADILRGIQVQALFSHCQNRISVIVYTN